MYAHLTDGAVDFTGPLPAMWRWPDGGVTVGFPSAAPSVIAAAGWLPLVDARPSLAEGEMWGDPSYEVGPDSVTVTAEVLPAEPTVDAAQAVRDAIAAGDMSGALTLLVDVIAPPAPPEETP